MKALVIAPQPFFTPRGTPFSVYYRTLVTAELGVEVDLLTYGQGQDVNIPGVRIIRIPRFAFFGDVKVGPSALKLFLDVFMMIWTVGLLLRNRYDFVHAHEEAVFFSYFLKPIFDFKLVYDMHSSLHQQLTNFQFTTSRFLIGIFKKLEHMCLDAADAVITICPDLAAYVTSRLSDSHKHFLIENSIFDPIQVEMIASASEHNLAGTAPQKEPPKVPAGRRLVVYAGTLEPYQGIDLLISAFERVINQNPDALLLVVGGTAAQVRHYAYLAQQAGLGANVLFTGRASQLQAKYYCSLASVLVSPRTAGTNTPLKIYEQLASGIPLVATRIHAHTQVLNDEVAILVEATAEDMGAGIHAALNGNGQRIRANAQRFYEENYARSVYEKKMQRLLERLS